MATTPIFWINPSGGFVFVNRAVCRHLGFSREDMLNMSVGDIDPSYPMAQRRNFWQELKENKKLTLETTHLRKDGTLVPVEVTTNYIEVSGEEYEFAFVTDITERKRAQEQIERDLKIKETLLQEIHHRVKNNFTVICSLLNLQSGKIDSKEDAVKAFHNSRQRIHSMLLVHENLYRARNLSHIDMKEYIETMIRDLLPVHQSNKKIHVNLEIMNVYLDINAAIPCGLILNEIITNAFKHAFTGRSEGMVFVSFRPNEDNRYELIVRDDGEGLPNQFDINAADTLGLQLIALLTEQIDGSLDIKNERGTEFRILFPKKI
jgi:PAS domain S-box-containing protein